MGMKETAHPRTGLGGSGAGKQTQISPAVQTQRMTWERFPAQPSPAQPGGPAVPPASAASSSSHGSRVYFSSDVRDGQPHGGSTHGRGRGCVAPAQEPQAGHSWLRWISVDSNGLNTTNVLYLDSDRSKPVNNETFAYHQSDSLHITSVLAVLSIFLDVGYAVFYISKALSKFWEILEY